VCDTCGGKHAVRQLVTGYTISSASKQRAATTVLCCSCASTAHKRRYQLAVHLTCRVTRRRVFTVVTVTSDRRRVAAITSSRPNVVSPPRTSSPVAAGRTSQVLQGRHHRRCARLRITLLFDASISGCRLRAAWHPHQPH